MLDLKIIYNRLYDENLKGSCLFRRYSAAIVKDDKIISVGYASSLDGTKCSYCLRDSLIKKYGKISEFFESCRVIHAETSAILNCKSSIEDSSLYLLGIINETGDVYKIAFPCDNCMKIIKYMGIKEICVFQSNDAIKCYEVEHGNKYKGNT